MGSNEGADVRRAFERLQETVEILTGRYREARREQRSLQDRLDSLVQERTEADTATAARLEAAARDRRRLIELEEQVLALQNRNATNVGRITDAERTISDREVLIAEQEDTILRLRAELDELKRSGMRQGEVEERARGLEDELREARLEALAARARSSDLEEQIRTLETSLASIYESHSGMEEKLRRSNESLARMTELETRAGELEQELEEARSRVASKGPELDDIKRELARRTEEHQELEELVAQLKERLAAAVVERERQSAAINELRAEVDRAALTAESLRQELQQTESSDEERLRAQRARIDGLTVDLSEALDTAAKRERELEEARRQIEAGRGELESLRNEYERLVLLGSAAGGAGLSDEDRQEMVTNINNAIELIDKYLVDG